MIFTDCVGALIVYDITDQDSFTKVNTWIKELRKYLPGDTPIIIAGNKCDMQNRQIPIVEAEKYAIPIIKMHNHLYFSYARGVDSEHISTSAKTGAGVLDIFTSLAKSKFSKLLNSDRNYPGTIEQEGGGAQEEAEHEGRLKSEWLR